MASPSAGEEAITNFVYGLVLSCMVAVVLNIFSKTLSRRDAKKAYGFLVDCILFDVNSSNSEKDVPSSSPSSAQMRAATASKPTPTSNGSPMFAWLSPNAQIQRAVHLVFCALGLVIAFVIYGVQQERIMTTEYEGGRFKNPNFLIFSNRFVAMGIALGVCYQKGQLRSKAALYKFSYCSISNILSSFCQFASLQFLSFPVLQVAKSCKALAVLLVSFLVFGKRFPPFEYAIATVVMLGAGAFFYIYAETTKGGSDSSNWTVGLTFLTIFILLDGFTNVWQGYLSKTYKTSQWQMMLGVNTFSMLLTLLIQGTDSTLVDTIMRLTSTPPLLIDVTALCTSAVIGQLFIFHTIATFGPLVFTLISIFRVILSIITSCIIYGHYIVPIGWLSIAVVFGAMAYRAYLKNSLPKERTKEGLSAHAHKGSHSSTTKDVEILVDKVKSVGTST
mmetsp:Transcript_27663/g.38463  ORF Transcript_27663/g.38463 Transcript_27663/m.38463 type:complete len:447 (+) Transcript_27663:118-1458(+)|eukprot:CAMPEP_0184484140 /NCGR_PEP_ID=MMETSP0113_2-20130426/5852_1 /TAXON_ID=91329 /ORGANISM="Norrisiella sphaerica, Strain BC52" /LENGTH=446 /DNA_ID=CAMNT_0026864973 /DNA_START=117 /DNA_END=1457 /DNA_ORIENTATION=-